MITTRRFDAAVQNLAQRSAFCLFLGLLAGTVLAEPTRTAEADESRRSTSSQHADGGRATKSGGVTTEDRYGGLVTDGGRSKPGARQLEGKPGTSAAESVEHDFWIYYADVILFGDDDDDGYFYGIDLLFDADTYWEVADVYAVLYLSLEGGPWNEYAVTEDFSIFGATSDDEFVVVTELESGYPRGSYDLLIELYDAHDGAFLASLGPADTSELSFLPLEDFDRDDPHVPGHSHGGGAADPWMFAVFVIAASLVRRRRSRVLARRILVEP